MDSLLPSPPDLSARREPAPRLLTIDDDAADAVFEALSSGTARAIFGALHDEPATASALAEAAETSLQNCRYHLEQLAGADLVEVAGTQYSSKGREMDVYAPTDEPLVVVASSEAPAVGLRALLERLVGGVGVLAVLSLLLAWAFQGDLAYLEFTAAGGAGDGSPGEPFTTGLFVGGVVVLAMALAWWYWSTQRAAVVDRIWATPALTGDDLEDSARALRAAGVGAVALGAGWLALAAFDVVLQPVGPVGPAQLLPLAVVAGAAVVAYANDGLLVSWAVVFLPLLALGLASIGLGLARESLAQLPGAIGYPLLLATIGAVTLGTVGFLVGMAFRVVLAGLDPGGGPADE